MAAVVVPFQDGPAGTHALVSCSDLFGQEAMFDLSCCTQCLMQSASSSVLGDKACHEKLCVEL